MRCGCLEGSLRADLRGLRPSWQQGTIEAIPKQVEGKRNGCLDPGDDESRDPIN